MFNKKQISVAVRTLCLLSAMGSSVAYGAISQVPLFLAQHPYPNIMFTLDNSGSMEWDFMPDSASQSYTDSKKNIVRINVDYVETTSEKPYKIGYHRSASLNRIFYDPAIRYDPWLDADGRPFPDPAVISATTADAAIDDPRAPKDSITRNNLIVPDTCSEHRTALKDCPEDKIIRNYKAVYYIHNGGIVNSINNYTRKVIDADWVAPAKSAERTDCRGAKCTYEEELQNFANWYTYYRKRIFTAIAGVSQTFATLDGKQRVGFGKINNPTATARQSLDGVAMAKGDIYTVLLGVRDFVTDDRKAFFNKLFEWVNPSGGTPLRRAMDDVGKYFQRTDDKGPWAEKPGVSRGVELACRKSFHILMTDGFWNGGAANTAEALEADNTDGVEYVHPRDPNVKYKYVASDPANKIYNSPYKSTLADIAMHYWKNDLYPNLENNVPYTATDPAFWQHLVQYTVGLGVDGELAFPGATEGLKDGSIPWPDPGDGSKDTPKTVDDLWHAAVNGHGLYFSAKNPKLFREGLTKALADIDDQTAVASTSALNFDQVGSTGNLVYVPSFQSSIWTGHLVARQLDSNGNLTATESWDAAGELPAWNARNIITMNSDNNTAVAFSWDNLGVTQKTQVSADLVDYLRGNDAKEKANGGPFRDRNKVVNDGRYAGAKNYAKANKLGDIVNSAPIYVHKLDHGYNTLNGYRKFVADKAARKPMLYVGANDGMLHGFDAATGVETFAYVPKSVYANLKLLGMQNYQHHYYVDGKLNEGDAFQASSSKWKTLLSASTGAGARAVFMLDVTDPVANSTSGASSVLWELTGEGSGGDTDLGYMLGKTEVVRLQNGAWAAIFGNGYQSSSGKAVMYIVDAFTGNAIPDVPRKIVLEGAAGSNGLSTPSLVFNLKRELVTAYAGDLRGNLWKVDFAKSGAATVAYSGKPLFVAKDAATPTAGTQPIIQRPALGVHPLGGYMVMFGTGKYFDTSDQANTQLQTAYGIWDNGTSEVPMTGVRNESLQEQTLTAQTGGASLTSISLDWGSKRGWFVDLDLLSGSRAVGDPYVTDDTTFYLTAFTPVGTQCDSGGKSQLMAFNYLSGGSSSVFDSSTSASRLSVVDVGATVSDPRVVRVPPTPPVPCTGSTCPTTPTTPEAAACPTRKIIVSQLDGTVSERSVNAQCKAPMRVWHQLDINY